MPIYFLVDNNDNTFFIIGSVVADNIDDADTYFSEKGLVFGEIMTAEDFKNESDLNTLENQSPES
jgi:hypothetical protein